MLAFRNQKKWSPQSSSAQELSYVPWAAALHEEHRMQTHNLSKAQDLIDALVAWAVRNEAASPALQAAQLRKQREAYGATGMSWAWSVVSTRACFMDVSKYHEHLSTTAGSYVDTQDTSTLVPWLDLLNHDSTVCVFIDCTNHLVHQRACNVISKECPSALKDLHALL